MHGWTCGTPFIVTPAREQLAEPSEFPLEARRVERNVHGCGEPGCSGRIVSRSPGGNSGLLLILFATEATVTQRSYRKRTLLRWTFRYLDGRDVKLPRKLVAEGLGSLLLLATVIGSGIMAENLAGGNDAVALLGNTLATGAILAVLITMLGPISGAHFNPAVTLAFVLRREIDARTAAAYVGVQVVGGLAGAVLAHAMFDMDLLQVSTKARTGMGQWLAEGVATFGLVATILATLKARPSAVAAMVGLYISAGYWFTASTSFANPAVTVARSFTDTFSGIAPVDAPAFIVAQFAGAAVATGLMAWLLRDAP